ncbi:MAG: trypsin-like peptidase domain-containing protein, partial [Armatimonadetes bacterium]|nr:trypsin-like peptidase domain-containing protein [Armatimonadota bacterium]
MGRKIEITAANCRILRYNCILPKNIKFLILFILLSIQQAFSLISTEVQIIEAIKKVRDAVVSINTYSYGEEIQGIGSGVILTHDGYILTNAHVIKKARNIIIMLSSGEKYPANLIKASADQDLAILKINSNKSLPIPQFGDSDKLQLGQIAIAIGNPMHFEWTVTSGVVSALGRKINYKGITYENLIQTDAAINPGNSGGALINSAGEVIGINTLVYTGSVYTHAQGLSFAIPIKAALK